MSTFLYTRIAFHRFIPKPSIFIRHRVMSFQGAVSTLQEPIKQLVVSATRDVKELVGEDEADEKEVVGWIEKIGQESFFTENSLKDLDQILISKTYLATNYLTAADIALYGTLHSIIRKLQSSEYYAVPAVTRYFDHVQSQSVVRQTASSLGDAFPTVSFDIENAPKCDRKAEAPKKKEKAPKAAPVEASQTVVVEAKPEPSKAEPTEKSQQRKEKKKAVAAEGDSKDTKSTGKVTVKPADDGEPIPSMIDLRVGHIVDIIKHPDADGLYIEQINLGEETGPRTVVSGLVNYIPIDQMRNKYLVAVCNLKPANMRGVKSFAMVLCATSKEGKEGGIELIQPPPGSKPGDRVYFEGGDYESVTPLPQLNPKKKIFETIQPGFITLDSKEAAWVNPSTKAVHKIRTERGVCVAPTLVGASLS